MKLKIIIPLLFLSIYLQAQVTRKRTTMLMGGRFEITIVAKTASLAEANIDTLIKEISRIEFLISDWKPTSQISQVNKNAGIKPVKVEREVFELTKRAIHLSEITSGAFDISFAAMDKIWKFDGSMTQLPSAEMIKKSVEKVGYKNIVLDSLNSTIFLKIEGMKIGFGALGEGYATDACRIMMLQKGIKAGIVNATGDMSIWGKNPKGGKWKIGVTDPFHKDSLFAIIPLSNSAVVTSGNYEKFVIFNGIRYSHIINPQTGYPASELSSVTVLGPSAEIANGFSTSLMVMGKDAGLQFINKHPEYKSIIFSTAGQIYLSDNLPAKTIKKWKRKI